MEQDLLQYYDLEGYLFNTVRPRFERQGCISAHDFFCIVIWKANRAKTRIARRLTLVAKSDLETSVASLTGGIARQPDHKARLRWLWEEWGFRLPMATAILTVLYPEDFTVYDARVCGVLGGFQNLQSVGSFESLWDGYVEYVKAVQERAPDNLSLRNKDRYLWAQSFHDQLCADLATGFGTA